MPEQMTNEVLWEKGLGLLESQLGPAQTLQFMAMISRRPFDYQHWRDEHFGEIGVEELLQQVKAMKCD
jgi:hypothetical protein